ncbi:S-adenosyl-L-methionine-dependent methyltransferase [Sodiomyces alkalinus F11]|uniref:S-adenosyl-L-methionine-dependent methyltransferase n=1 Tax=Sodiomyces alkalinus (strain CBS 110278 / VKM F-3762 / F11) TaxID=1314773 RepID=A0A3N2PW52_SODAK|nr:S-adenosyl-L-methionine-dependent methyltransferase [Sodiomyces alkalinus F11]ROT38731.1 S-adenosyl-L-methionine-dependent methyltransferase [Sodiomyces alkalinus F11]
MDLNSGPSTYDNPHTDVATPSHIDSIRPVGFSDYGSSLNSSGFTSVASYILRHCHRDGRRYQSFARGGYPLPNDDIEQEREEMKHHMIKRLFDGSDYLAPIGGNPQRILDIGTGIGLWAIDVADKFPSAQVIGVDITPIQIACAPLNVTWRIDDIQTTAWDPPYSDLDFVHLRSVVTTLADPIHVLTMAYQWVLNLKPGGWIEIQETSANITCDDGSIPENYPPTKFRDLYLQNFAPAHGWDPLLVNRLPDVLKQIGFVKARHKEHKLPIGAWCRDTRRRELGLFVSKYVLWEFFRAALVQWPQMGLSSKQEAETLQRDIKRALDSPEIHAYSPWVSVWAQKPYT